MYAMGGAYGDDGGGGGGGSQANNQVCFYCRGGGLGRRMGRSVRCLSLCGFWCQHSRRHCSASLPLHNFFQQQVLAIYISN